MQTLGQSKSEALPRLRPGRGCVLAYASRQPITAPHGRGTCRLQLFPFSWDSHAGPSHRVWTSKTDRWQTHIKVLEGQHFKSGSLLARKPFLLEFPCFTSYKILGTAFWFFPPEFLFQTPAYSPGLIRLQKIWGPQKCFPRIPASNHGFLPQKTFSQFHFIFWLWRSPSQSFLLGVIWESSRPKQGRHKDLLEDGSLGRQVSPSESDINLGLAQSR